ncbi:MAG TPA: hypothetical protein VE954_15450 [Oligoflexus sp.]|uniref:hypothetical protein n=1 Tax=Oligoflexus sp. TaxID=1971216 RepID=UPI002D5AB9DA|nr:hypothetical protein [Oligoflexus sp.]HYX34499.1 hypothetical protein [Oligoflexus sp.]
MKSLGSSQTGSSGLLVVIALLGASLLGLQFVGHRSEQEMRAESHREWRVDKLKVKSALQSQSNCSAVNFTSACAVGTTLALPNKSGGVLVAANGSTKIGRWNVKIECKAKSTTEYWVTAAALDASNTFIKDPLTQKPMAWSDLMPLQDACGSGSADIVLEKSSPCYGTAQGTGPLPAELATASGCVNCKYLGHYCSDTQRAFPSCPDGYQGIFRYVDRYGWGGIDFTKYTICSKI